jgi:hypothetical protein
MGGIMAWKKKKETKEPIKEPIKEVIIEKVEEKPTQAVCKSPCCQQYATKEDLCNHCWNDLHSVGYK